VARLLTCGFELGGVTSNGIPIAEDNNMQALGGSLTVTADTGTVRSGARSLKAQADSTNTGGNYGMTFTGVVTRTYWARMAANFSAFPGAGTTAQPISIALAALSAGAEILINPGGVVTLNRVSNDGLLVTGPTIFTNTWHVYEVSWNPSTGACQGWVDGVSFGTATTDTTATTTLCTGYGCGFATTNTVMFLDDWALNDDQGTSQNTRCGDQGKIVLLKPISDNSRVGFTTGAGGTTALWDAVDNTPPVGVVQTSSTATSQIKDTTSNTTDTYVANLATPGSLVSSGGGGMAAADTAVLAQGIANKGNSSATARTVGLSVTANPVIAEATDSTFTTAAGTWPTGWTTVKTLPAYAPSLTLGTSPTVQFRKGTASTDYAMADFMGIYVEYTPGTPKVGRPQIVGQAVMRAAMR
jgi:hypothetical protein